MNKKIKNILLILLILFIFAFVCFIIYDVNDFIIDYNCSTMPLNEFFDNEMCQKYWRYR